MQLSSTHLVSLILVLLLSLVPSLYAGRKVKSEEDFSVGGRSAGTVLVAGSIIGTIVGGAATVGTAQLGFTLGLAAWWFTLGSGIALLIMATFYARPLRQSGLTTISEFLVVSYGKKAGPLASLAATAGIFFSIVASTLTALNLIAGIFRLSLPLAAILLVTIVLGFVFLGGINGSGMAGLFKIGLIFATLFVSGSVAFQHLGGLNGLTQTFPAAPWFSLFGGGVQYALVNLLSLVIGIISTQTYIQALFSAKDSKTAAVGCVVAALIVIPVGLPSVIIGMFMHVNHPGISSIEALPLYLTLYMPDWLGGAALAALVLSAIGSIAGLSLGCSTMLTRDIFKAVLGFEKGQQLLWINRSLVLVITVTATIFTFYHLDSYVLEWNYLSMALRGAGVFLPLTFAIAFKNRIAPGAGLAAMLAGILVALTWKFLVPGAGQALFPSLAFNLLFLIPGVLFAGKVKRHEL
ncbi:MAG: sodium:solute symporter family protein [Acidaminococcaceae bacterium]